jgi:gas vesicle protein
MQEQTDSTARTMAIIFVTGALLGAAAGLLLAPKSGRETRKELKTYANKVSREVTDVAHRTKVGIEAAVQKGRELLDTKAA